MIVEVFIDLPISEAQAVKELLAMRLEGVGKVKILHIRKGDA